MSPATVHFGHSEEVLAARRQTLLAAYQAHPERFVRQIPEPLAPPREIWINPPQSPTEANPPALTPIYTNSNRLLSQSH